MFFNPSHQAKSAHEVVMKAVEAAKKMAQMPQRGAQGWKHLSKIAGKKHLFKGRKLGEPGWEGDENNSRKYYQNEEWQIFAVRFEPYEIHTCEESDMKKDDDPNKKKSQTYTKKVGNSGISHLDPRKAFWSWHLHPRFALRESKRIIMKDPIHKTRGLGELS